MPVSRSATAVTDRDRPDVGTFQTRNAPLVTDADLRSESKIDSRHAPAVTGPDWRAYSPTTSRHARPSSYEGLSLTFDAQRYADVCGKCGATIPPDAPVALNQRVRKSGASLCHQTTLCLTCAAYWMEKARPQRETCRQCQRPIYRRRWNCRRFCCDRCAWLAASATRTARGAAERAKHCVVCGQSFTAPRRDARTCSPACRQRAYRQRRPTVASERGRA